MSTVGNYVNAHPLREELVQEIHARPFELLSAPERGSHIAMMVNANQSKASLAHLADLCELFEVPPPSSDDKFYSQNLGKFRLRWEQHTEFCVYTFLQKGKFSEPFVNPIIDLVPSDWLSALPGEALAAVHFSLESREQIERGAQDLSQLFGGNAVIGSSVSGGGAQVWSDLQIHDDGFSRILIHDNSLTELQGGRLVQRLLEINAYRLLALLSLPLARQSDPQIHRMDAELRIITQQLTGEELEEKNLLDNLSHLASELEELGARTSYRFNATRAYFDIVQSRLEEIRQERIEGLQTFTEFLERRLVPAVNYCFSTRDNLEALAERMSRIGSLLRTRVEVQIEEQNRDLLASMNHRAMVQLRLQRLVERLSIVAITYYLLGLVKYSLDGIRALGYSFDTTIATGISVPIVLLLVWMVLFSARRTLGSVSIRDEIKTNK